MPSYKNLVFKGGGVRGIAYLGAIEYLYENNLMRHVERVAGTSVGAITAAVLSLNFLDFAILKKVSDSLEFRKVPAEKAMARERPAMFREVKKGDSGGQIRGIAKNLTCTMRLVQDLGWYTSDYFYYWMKAVIASQFTVGKESYTFADFRDSGIHAGGRDFLDLHITGTDVTNHLCRVFSFDTTPDMEVALAVRISMSIPLYFEAIEFQYPGTDRPQVYADGGVVQNYPVGLFDDPRYCRRLVNGINPETLGFFVYSPREETRGRDIRNIAEYVSGLFDTLLGVQEKLVADNEKHSGRTIFIDDMGVPVTQFDIEPEDESYKVLYSSGYGAAKDFFADRAQWKSLLADIRKHLGRRAGMA